MTENMCFPSPQQTSADQIKSTKTKGMPRFGRLSVHGLSAYVGNLAVSLLRAIMVHAAAKGVRTDQVTVKLVFDVEDIAAFRTESARNGLLFSAEHPADGYSYANAKDPCGNNIQISSRAFRKAD
jgi:hypothetical protein